MSAALLGRQQTPMTPGEVPAPTGRVCGYGVFVFSSRRRHTRYIGDWSSDVCSSDLVSALVTFTAAAETRPPDWSVTVPERLAETCAATGAASRNRRRDARVMSCINFSVSQTRHVPQYGGAQPRPSAVTRTCRLRTGSSFGPRNIGTAIPFLDGAKFPARASRRGWCCFRGGFLGFGLGLVLGFVCRFDGLAGHLGAEGFEPIEIFDSATVEALGRGLEAQEHIGTGGLRDENVEAEGEPVGTMLPEGDLDA